MEVRNGSKNYDSTIKHLKKSGRKDLIKKVEYTINCLSHDHVIGDSVKKHQIPRYYKQKYNVTSLYRVDLSDRWRLIYTITSEIDEKIAIILDLFDHKEYAARFHY